MDIHYQDVFLLDHEEYIVIVVIWDQQAVQKDILLSEAITGTLASIGGYL